MNDDELARDYPHVAELLQNLEAGVTDKEWEAFLEYSRKRFPNWTPDRSSVELYLEYEEKGVIARPNAPH